MMIRIPCALVAHSFGLFFARAVAFVDLLDTEESLRLYWCLKPGWYSSSQQMTENQFRTKENAHRIVFCPLALSWGLITQVRSRYVWHRVYIITRKPLCDDVLTCLAHECVVEVPNSIPTVFEHITDDAVSSPALEGRTHSSTSIKK